MLASNVNEYYYDSNKTHQFVVSHGRRRLVFTNISEHHHSPRARELCQNMFVIVIPLDEQLLAIYQQRHYNTNPLSSVINDDVNGKYNACCLRVRALTSRRALSLFLS